MHKVIIINGLGGEITPIKWATRRWQRYGLFPVYHYINWLDKKADFEKVLGLLLEKIDSLVAEGNTVSLVGCSAGASAVCNAFIERKNVIKHVVSLSGPLRREGRGEFRSLNWWKGRSPLLIHSVLRVESKLGTLTNDDKKKIMTTRSLFWDELIPPATVLVEGAYNIEIPIPGHILVIYMALSFFNGRLIRFLNS